MNEKYADILHLPHHQSKTRTPMAMELRAAQFAPFAALTGHDAAVKETARLTETRMVLDENAVEELNRTLGQLSVGDRVQVTYFRPDEKKEGGAYLTVTDIVTKIDRAEHQLLLGDEKIPMEEMIELKKG